ncbi:SDR family oxidoreductase [Sneathiella sp.]|uniref:SDR family oxidoreductase n=1 Tax=Sneathiella sp. TaxID=1964365 RepID=UPI0035656D48
MSKANTQDNKHPFGAGRDLGGKIAWITGAGTGIGQAAAVALAGAGMEIILSGRRKANLDETATLVRAAGCEPVIETLDISDPTEVNKVVARIEERFGGIDVAVLSAGINIKNRTWEKLDVEGWDAVVKIDLNGAFYCCHALLPTMRKKKSGLIINVASWAGVHVSRMGGPAYNAAKHGMVAMSESINMEEAVNGIRSCALCPGEVATPLLEKRPVPVSDEQKAAMLQPEDLGETVLFLARLDERVCVNQLVISPTANRIYVGTKT